MRAAVTTPLSQSLGAAVPVMHPVVTRDHLARMCLTAHPGLEALKDGIIAVGANERIAKSEILVNVAHRQATALVSVHFSLHCLSASNFHSPWL